jgi:hypothetical protein
VFYVNYYRLLAFTCRRSHSHTLSIFTSQSYTVVNHVIIVQFRLFFFMPTALELIQLLMDYEVRDALLEGLVRLLRPTPDETEQPLSILTGARAHARENAPHVYSSEITQT